MRGIFRLLLGTIALTITVLLAAHLFGIRANYLLAKEKLPPVGPDDATLRLFHLLDTSRGGKLADFYILADVYRDPTNPNDEFQHVLRAEYDKNRGFGKLNLHVRAVGKMAPEQLKSYTPKEIYEFGVADAEKFVKTEPGSFGRPGDVYLRAEGERPLASAPVTDEVRKVYETFILQHLLPALEKR